MRSQQRAGQMQHSSGNENTSTSSCSLSTHSHCAWNSYVVLQSPSPEVREDAAALLMALCTDERKDADATRDRDRPFDSPATALMNKRKNRKRTISMDSETPATIAIEGSVQFSMEPPGSAASSVSSSAITLPAHSAARSLNDQSSRNKSQRRDQTSATASGSTSFQSDGSASTESDTVAPSSQVAAQNASLPLSAAAAVFDLSDFDSATSDNGDSTDDEVQPILEAARLQPKPTLPSQPQELVKLSIQRSAIRLEPAAPRVVQRAPVAPAAAASSTATFVSSLPRSIQARYSRSICCRHVVIAFSIFQCKQASAGHLNQTDPLAAAQQLRQQQQIEMHLQQEQQRLDQQRLMLELQRQQLASFQRVMCSPLPSFQQLSPCASFGELNLSSPLNSMRAPLIHTRSQYAPSAQIAAAATASAHVAASPQPPMPVPPATAAASPHPSSPSRAPRSSALSVSPHLPPSPAARPPLARPAQADPSRASSRRSSAASGISPPGTLAPSVLAVVNACSTGALTSASMVSATASPISALLSPSSPPGGHMELVSLKAAQARELQQGMQEKGARHRQHDNDAAQPAAARPAAAATSASTGDTVPASATSTGAHPFAMQQHHSTALTRLMQLANQPAPVPPSPTSLAQAGHYRPVHQPIRPARRNKQRTNSKQLQSRALFNPTAADSKQRLCRT